MKRIERRARVETPPEELFAYLSDLANLPEWQPGIVSAEITSGDDIGVGTTAIVVRDLMGQRIEAPMTVTAYEPPSRFAIRGEVSGVKATAELHLGPVDGGSTDLGFSMEIRGSFITSFMEPMIAGAAGGEIDAGIARIQGRFAKPG
ncbi:MAG TPA: SRPBCC family protein [Candidatus Limnocylindria bacterium]|nr:SRPBCC family protein [Candidatus Limnocylindria bacterium]